MGTGKGIQSDHTVPALSTSQVGWHVEEGESWQSLEPLPLQPWQGLAVTLDATPSSYDKRSQAWIFALCIHTFPLGTLMRKGTITGMAPGPQTKARAFFQGLITLAQHVLTPINVIIQVGSVWEAWTNSRKRKGFEDGPGL